MSKKVLLILVFMITISNVANSELLNIGDRRIEVVDGNVSELDAGKVVNYSENLYDRGEYNKCKTELYNLIKVYRGRDLPNIYYLIAKSHFMLGETSSSFEKFLYLYEMYPSSRIVKSGKLAETIKNASLKISKTITDSSYSNIAPLESLLCFHKLYINLSGKESEEVNQVINTEYVRSVFINKDDIQHKGENKNGYIIVSERSSSGGDFLYNDRARGLITDLVITRCVMPEVIYLVGEYPKTFTVQGNKKGADVVRGLGRLPSLGKGNNDKVDWIVNNAKSDIPYRDIESGKINQIKMISKNGYSASGEYTGEIYAHATFSYRDELILGHIKSGTLRMKFMSLAQLAIAKHGSLYGWTGLDKIENL